MTDPLAAWFSEQLDREVILEGLDRVEVGHSAETLLLTLVHEGGRQDVVLRMRPPYPGLLEPYDLPRQFTVLRALEGTPVRAPRALWLEPTGDVLGREFYVMERLPGTVYERGVPDEISGDPALVRRLCDAMVDQIAEVHVAAVDLGGGHDHLDRELDHWAGELTRSYEGAEVAPLLDGLRSRRPAPCPRITLVHGDTKPGNFAFLDGEVSALFDWELATMGDPRADIGWAEVAWRFPGYVTSCEGAPTADELVARWEDRTGIAADERPWFRAFQAMKMGAILLVGGLLVEQGHADDPRFSQMALGGPFLLQAALADLEVAP